MRFYVAALAHETNSFSPIPTRLANFEAGLRYRPKIDLEVDPCDVLVGYGDMIRLGRARGHDMVVGPAAWAQPSGLLVREDYEALRDDVLDGLRAALPVNGVLLMLHGSQMAHDYEDCEGDLLERVRALVGAGVPVGVELDLHCNISELMIRTADAIIACKEYPHTDFPERARELLDIIEAAAGKRVRPVMARYRVPMLSKFHTTREPMRGFVDRTSALEGHDDILSVTLAHGFPWGDMPDVGSSVVVVADGQADKARRLAEVIGQEFFGLRADVPGHLLGIDAALDRVARRGGRPLVVADVADNAGGGAASDSTFILRRLIDRGITNAAIGMVWDPVAVEMAASAGVGAEFPLRMGGKLGPASGQPVDAVVKVLAVAEDPTQLSLDGRTRDRLGRTVAVGIGGLRVVLNSRRQQVFSPECFSAVGIDITRLDLVVVKSSQHFHTQFSGLAAEIVYCDSPGTLNNHFAALPYRRINRPIWPIDPVALP